MTAEDDVDDFIEQFTLAQGELLKGNPEPAKNLCSRRQDVTLANPLGPVVRGWEQVAAATDQAASQFRVATESIAVNRSKLKKKTRLAPKLISLCNSPVAKMITRRRSSAAVIACTWENPRPSAASRRLKL